MECVICFLPSSSSNRCLIKGVVVDVDERWFQKDTAYEYLMQSESGVKVISFKRIDNSKDIGWIHVEIIFKFNKCMSVTHLLPKN